ncbi:MAG: diphosphomevalonate decarboxylase [Gammaproteobacteria bacterium]|nr:diphosphomevalonate decarboxylase [Gammaproteobacteria bacterium]
MKKSDIIKLILGDRQTNQPGESFIATSFAPTNIALCKYWGKRNEELHLPMTSSLSIALPDHGSEVALSLCDAEQDQVKLNHELILPSSKFYQRLSSYLDLFRTEKNERFNVEIHSTIPIAAGLASSACGFASLVLALDQLFNWQLDKKSLSILARLGSGSASRSLWDGFVEWHVGERADGMDSFAEPIHAVWPELCLGLLIFNTNEKMISSRDAMRETVETSSFYKNWPQQVSQDLFCLHKAIEEKDFELLGKTAESNAMLMHATMRDAKPSIDYCLPETIAAMQKIQQLRQDGLPLYFTQDAGPNLKLLFCENDVAMVREHFNVEVVRVFSSSMTLL